MFINAFNFDGKCKLGTQVEQKMTLDDRMPNRNLTRSQVEQKNEAG